MSSDAFSLKNDGYKCCINWRLLVECCRRIKPESIDLSNPPCIATLGSVFPAVFPETAVDNPNEHIQSSAYEIASDEMDEYRQWFVEVRARLEGLTTTFLDGFVSTCALENYRKNLALVKDLYSCYVFRNWEGEAKLTEMLQAVANLETQLSQYLYYRTKDKHQW